MHVQSVQINNGATSRVHCCQLKLNAAALLVLWFSSYCYYYNLSQGLPHVFLPSSNYYLCAYNQLHNFLEG